MANISSNIDGLEKQVEGLNKLSMKVNSIQNQFDSNKNNIDSEILERHNIRYKLSEISKDLKSLEKRLRKSGICINTAINYYFDAECTLRKLAEGLEIPKSQKQYNDIFEENRNFKTSNYSINNYGKSDNTTPVKFTKNYVDSIDDPSRIITLIQAYQTDWEKEEKFLGKYRFNMTDNQKIYNENSKLLRARLVVLDWRFGKVNKAIENMQSENGRYKGEFEQYLLDRYIDTIKKDNGRITKEKEFQIQQMIEDVFISKEIGYSYRQIEHITNIEGVNVGEVRTDAFLAKEKLILQLAKDTKHIRDIESSSGILKYLHIADSGYALLTKDFAINYYRKYGKSPFEYMASPDNQDINILSREDYSAVIGLKTLYLQYSNQKNSDAMYAVLRAIDTIRQKRVNRYKYDMQDNNGNPISLYMYHDKKMKTKMSIRISNKYADEMFDNLASTTIGFTKYGVGVALESLFPLKDKGKSIITNDLSEGIDWGGTGLSLTGINPGIGKWLGGAFNIAGFYYNYDKLKEHKLTYDVYINEVKPNSDSAITLYSINPYKFSIDKNYKLIDGRKYKSRTDVMNEFYSNIPDLTLDNWATSFNKDYNFTN